MKTAHGNSCVRDVIAAAVSSRLAAVLEMSGWLSQQPYGTSLLSLDGVAAAMTPFSDAEGSRTMRGSSISNCQEGPMASGFIGHRCGDTVRSC